MRAMLLVEAKKPLQLHDIPIPEPKDGQVLLKVEACGVCRTDLHIVDGDLKEPHLPLILGHQVVGRVVSDGKRWKKNERVGVPWLAKTCGHCSYCANGAENLCDNGLYMGYQLNGGYAEYAVAYEDYMVAIPDEYSPLHAAPLLCAGLIGYRTLKLAGNVKRLGFYGFGAAAHILLQVANYLGIKVYAFTRPGDIEGQNFAKKLGAVWAGSSLERPEELLDAALVFAPVGELIPVALQVVKKGGSVVSAGIHMSDIPSFPYALLYGERQVRSVTNLTREDGREFFELIRHAKIETVVTPYRLEEANKALNDLRASKFLGSAVLVP